MRKQLDKALTGFIWLLAAHPKAALRLQLFGAFCIGGICLIAGFNLVYGLLWLLAADY